MPNTTIARPGDAFVDEIIRIIRALGLQKPDTTPCGQPVAVPQAQALMEIAGHAGCSQKALALRLGIDKSNLSRVLASLEDRGWVQRVRDERDSRVLLLNLTARGRRMAERLRAARAQRFNAAFAQIPPKQRRAVLESLSLLVEALQ